MRILAKIILIILFIPLFLIFLISINLRFQILKPSFWDKTFTSENTYTKLSQSINRSLESQTIAEGGRAVDVSILTDLITPENLKEVISRNINNILLFTNGRSTELSFYIPVNKIPEPLLSTNLIKVKSQMTLTELIKEFNIQSISPIQVQYASRLGSASWILFALSTFLVVLFLYLLYLLTNLGKRLIAPGFALVLSGLAAFTVTGAGTVIRVNWTKDLAGRNNLGDSVIGIITPPIIKSTLNIWLYIAAISMVIGFILFFVKKPGYNKGNKAK